MFDFNRFRRSEDGSYSIEGVLWLPVFVVMLGAILDLSLVFHHRADLAHTVHQINRAVVVGQFTSVDDAQAYLRERLDRYGPDATGSVTISGNEVETRVSVPAEEVSRMGAIPLLSGMNMNLRYSHLMER